ncbi:MAG: class I SAM-dependent methyltransferase [Dehalococcoidia bacterium]|nr:class I SAM-dependent methyltransferase [Dehalococcoidia bacterium]
MPFPTEETTPPVTKMYLAIPALPIVGETSADSLLYPPPPRGVEPRTGTPRQVSEDRGVSCSYDPTLFRGAAVYYLRGRPSYAYALPGFLARESNLARRCALDVGCGPGRLTVDLAMYAAEVVGLDPDGEMLAEAVRYAEERRVRNVRWVQGTAEEILPLGLGRFALVTLAQSFHWTDREAVAEVVYDLLEPGGVLALIGHEVDARPRPAGPGAPSIPHEAIQALLDRYLGPERRAGQGLRDIPAERHEEVLARTRFGRPEAIYLEGRADLVQSVDDVLANVYSMSYAAPWLFGGHLAAFDADLRAVLTSISPAGTFWDWPGDTEVLLARRPVS